MERFPGMVPNSAPAKFTPVSGRVATLAVATLRKQTGKATLPARPEATLNNLRRLTSDLPGICTDTFNSLIYAVHYFSEKIKSPKAAYRQFWKCKEVNAACSIRVTG
jgi:hypothetical protein